LPTTQGPPSPLAVVPEALLARTDSDDLSFQEGGGSDGCEGGDVGLVPWTVESPPMDEGVGGEDEGAPLVPSAPLQPLQPLQPLRHGRRVSLEAAAGDMVVPQAAPPRGPADGGGSGSEDSGSDGDGQADGGSPMAGSSLAGGAVCLAGGPDVPHASLLDSVLLALWEDCADQGLFRWGGAVGGGHD
jgi:hypothetical protein